MPDGSYCDVVLAGARIDVEAAARGSVTVADGTATFDLDPGRPPRSTCFARA